MRILFVVATFCLTMGRTFPHYDRDTIEFNIDEQEAQRQYAFASQPHRPDVSFMIADMKYRPGVLKVLELGEGPRSVFTGHDDLVDLGLDIKKKKIWAQFWNYLKKFKLPIWFVTTRLSRNLPHGDRLSFAKQVAYSTFLKIGGRLRGNLKALLNDRTFKRLTRAKSSHLQRIQDFKGIVIINYHNFSNLNHDVKTCKKCLEITRFKREHKDFLVLDDASRMFANNKNLADELFRGDDFLQRFRPICNVYDKKYHANLALEIIGDIKSDILVIKPLNAAKGDGVIMVDKEHLDEVLFNILTKSDEIKNSTDTSFTHWLKDTNDRFIVESFEKSKFIRFKGKSYDATLRTVFILRHDRKKIYVNFLGWYWKLPEKSVSAKGTYTEKAKSSFKNEDKRMCSSFVSKQDVLGAKQILKKILPKMYAKMLAAKRKREQAIL